MRPMISKFPEGIQKFREGEFSRENMRRIITGSVQRGDKFRQYITWPIFSPWSGCVLPVRDRDK